jgi:hypothetical protein
LHWTGPLWFCSVRNGPDKRRERSLVDNHPQDEGQRLLYSSQKQGIFANTGTDDANEELEYVGEEVRDDLHNPETKPNCQISQYVVSFLQFSVLTDLNPNPELLLVGVANRAFNYTNLRQNDRNSQQKCNRCYVDHVARDDAVVENLGVDPAHVVECRLFLMVATRRQRCTSPRVDLCNPPASPMEHARLF